MRIWFVFLLVCLMSHPLTAEENGRARAELIVSHATIKAGQSIPAAIRMVYEKGWHGYWTNPGESGMRTEVEWQLPDGWTASPMQFPVPKRFVTGELVSYGYEGEVLIPFVLTAPAALEGPQTIVGTVSWLACNEKSCVAGEAAVQVELATGKAVPGPQAAALTSAIAKLPTADKTLQLHVTQAGDMITLTLTGAAHLDLQEAEFFPVTEQTLNPRDVLLWKKTATGYEALAKKNEYAGKELSQLSLVIVPKSPLRALFVEWKK